MASNPDGRFSARALPARAFVTRALAGLLLAALTFSAVVPLGERIEALRKALENARYAEAEKGARELLREIEAHGAGESSEAAEVMDVLVPALIRGGKAQAPESRDLAEKAVAIKERSLGPEHPELARSLGNLGTLLQSLGDNAAARPILERALAIREKALGPDHPDVATSLSDLGILLYRAGDLAAVRPLFERALAIRERALGPDHEKVASSLNNLASLLRETGDYERAGALFERTLAIDERRLGPEHPNVAQDLGNIGILFIETGDYPGAMAPLERSLAIQEKALGPEHADLAAVLNTLAVAEKELGEYLAAREHLDRAVRIQEKAFGPDHPGLAVYLNNLANVLKPMGDMVGARALYERTLKIQEKSLGPEHPSVAGALNNLALLLAETGDAKAARPLYDRALAIDEKVHGPDHRYTAGVLTNLGILLASQGDVAGARGMMERALKIHEQSLGPDHSEVARDLNNLGKLLRDAGDLSSADPLLRRALAIREKALGPDHPDVAQTLGVLAESAFEKGAATEALALASRAARILDRHTRETLAGLPERQALELVRTREQPEAILFSGLLTSGGHPAEWTKACWEWTLRHRAMVLDELAARHRIIVAGASPEAREAWEAQVAARHRLAEIWVRGPEGPHPEQFPATLEKARREKEDAESALARLSVRYRRERDLEETRLPDIVRALPARSALVEIVRVPARSLRSKDREPHDIALVLLRDGRAAFVDLGLSSSIDRRVLDWRSALRESASAAFEGPAGAQGLEKLERAASRLRRAVWDPMVRLTGTKGTVFLVPDGSIHQVPFGALTATSGRFLIEQGPAIHLLSTGRDLVRLAGGREKASGGSGRVAGRSERVAGGSGEGWGVLALGGPDFDASETVQVRVASAGVSTPAVAHRGTKAECKAIKALRWSPLAESEREARQIQALLEEKEPVVLLTGAQASEQRFKREAPGKRILHLATHGFFLQGGCAAPGGTDNPLLLSGLVLAGANRAVLDGEEAEDGVLTAEEIAALDLGGAELAVLSACDTGRGEVAIGEGVFGLRRALDLAGVRTVVMSLWPVPEKHARRWMTSFYRARLSGASVIEGSRRASLEILHGLREEGRPPHPCLWAGFVAAGGWR